MVSVSTADSVPAPCWSNRTQVEPARVTQVRRHGHSICQQTNQWKGWTPSLSEGVMGCGRRRQGCFRAATAGWREAPEREGRRKKKKAQFSMQEGGRAQPLRRWGKLCWLPAHALPESDANPFNLTMISWMSASLATDTCQVFCADDCEGARVAAQDCNKQRRLQIDFFFFCSDHYYCYYTVCVRWQRLNVRSTLRKCIVSEAPVWDRGAPDTIVTR